MPTEPPITTGQTTKAKAAGLPQNKEAEQAILGAILENNEVLHEVAPYLTDKSFYHPRHQIIFQAMLDLDEDRQPFDEITIGDRLHEKGQLENAGSYGYLTELRDCVPYAENAVHYAKIVQEHGLLRELIFTTSEIAKQSREPDKDVSELIAITESKIHEIASRSVEKKYSHIKDILDINMERLEELSEKKEEITGLPTGFIDLDKITSGLQSSDLLIIAARPSMGKTAFALNIAQHIATQKENPGAVLLFSLEMSKEQLSMRMLSSAAKIDSHIIRTGRLEVEDWDKLAITVDKLSEAPVYINDTPEVNTYQLMNIAKQLDKDLENGLSLVLVDYLQLMKPSRQHQSREQEIAEISRSLKGLAKELNIPVIALSQLNRALENRSDKRPMMSDLRESGSIEQDADIIMFIYRDEVYHEDSKDKGKAEIIIGKHRNGSLGTVELAFIGKYTKFANYSARDDSMIPPIPPQGVPDEPVGGP